MAIAPLKQFFIVGPTASAKSDLAAQIALRANAEIVGADAFQVYTGLDRLTAKPSKDILAAVPHHLIGEIPLHECYDVARYRQEATHRIAEIQKRGKTALIVGGAGLYIRALTHGLADLPPADASLRIELQALPLDTLQTRLLRLDPIAYHRIDLKNPRRLVRALEVCLLTKRPFSSFQAQWRTPTANAPGVFLNPSRPVLYARINARTESMFQNGVTDEVNNVSTISSTACQAIGFSLIKNFLAGGSTRLDCIEAVSAATRHYAKRQITWFSRDSTFEEIDSGDPSVFDTLASQLAQKILAHR